jgi:RimJ/RimL family protein N-acetyltransferase
MKIFLRAFEKDDLHLLNQWHNDSEINSLTTGVKRYVSSEYDMKWLEEKMLDNNTQVYCAVCENETKRMIGYTSLNNIDYINRKAFWGGLVIGDKKDRSKGYATSASIEILKYGFCELGLNKICAVWLAEHKTAIFQGKLLGFVEEGWLRQDVFKGNKYHDVLVMSILKTDFEKRHLEELKLQQPKEKITK